MPFRGHRPKTRAGAAAVSSTKRRASIRPLRTPPSHSSIIRVSIPGAPFGILEKSPSPRAFSASVNGQWSVETSCSSPLARPRHSASWSAASRSGGDIT